MRQFRVELLAAAILLAYWPAGFAAVYLAEHPPSPDITQAAWELGSAVFSLLNIRAIRRSKSIAGVHWAPTAFFFLWGLYNLWFYTALHLPLAWWAGLAITATNLVWLAHVGWYVARRG